MLVAQTADGPLPSAGHSTFLTTEEYGSWTVRGHLYSWLWDLSMRGAQSAVNRQGSFGSHYEEQESSSFSQHRSPVNHIISVISNQHYQCESFSGTAPSLRREPSFNPLQKPIGMQHVQYRCGGQVISERVYILFLNVSHFRGNLLLSVKSDDR